MRILFFAWGGGNGHLIRVSVLARAAQDAGHSVHVRTSEERQVEWLRRHGLTGSVYPRQQTSNGHWSDWNHLPYARECVRSDIETIERLAADLVVHDGRPSVGVASLFTSTPVTALLQSIHLPGHSYIGRGEEAIWGQLADSMNQIIGPLVGSRFVDGRESIALGGVAIPSIPELDPVPSNYQGQVRYAGPLTSMDPPTEESGRHVAGKILFYKTHPKEHDAAAFERIFADIAHRIVIATGGGQLPTSLACRFENVSLAGRGTIAQCGSAVIHGGHGTSLLMLQHGIPFVAIPGGSPERQQNAHNLEALGVALHTSDARESNWDLHDANEGHVNWEEVRERIDSIDRNPTVRQASQAWARRLRKYNHRDALDIVLSQARVPKLSPASRSSPKQRP